MHTHKLVLVLGAAGLAACSGDEAPHVVPQAQAAEVMGTTITVRDTTITAVLEAAGIAEPIAQATLSTKLMGTVIAVTVKEGDLVRASQPLVRIDARDLVARREQVASGIASAEAVRHEAELQATRIRALYVDSAAPRAQLDAVEAGLARAEAGVRAARATEAELAAVTDYAVVRAPFAGVVTQRLVDPGAFAAPGAPLVTVQDHRQLRVSVTMPPDAARGLRRGDRIDGSIEGQAVQGRIEGVVPAASGSLYTVNATVDNREARYAPGGSATLAIPRGTRSAVLIPARAVRREGDLTGVQVQQAGGTSVVRWVRLGPVTGGLVEVVSGLRAGDVIVVPVTAGRE